VERENGGGQKLSLNSASRIHRAARSRVPARLLAEEVHAHALALQLGDLVGDVFLEQIHERGDLGGGRFQFSSENANSVSTSTPASIAPSTASRTAFHAARWPNGRGSRRSFAQRPLPSMMIATWRGIGPESIRLP